MYDYDALKLSNTIVKYMAPGSEVKALKRGRYGHTVSMYLILENLLCVQQGKTNLIHGNNVRERLCVNYYNLIIHLI